jgi:hypothetical protein
MPRLVMRGFFVSALAIVASMVKGAQGKETVLSAEPPWDLISSDLGTICTGAAFVDANTGYVPIAQNGVGTSIQKSTDGGAFLHATSGGAILAHPPSLPSPPPPPPPLPGVTWTDDETAEPFSLLLLDIAARKGSNGNDNVAVVVRVPDKPRRPAHL